MVVQLDQHNGYWWVSIIHKYKDLENKTGDGEEPKPGSPSKAWIYSYLSVISGSLNNEWKVPLFIQGSESK